MAKYREIAEIFFTANDREYRRVMGRMKSTAHKEATAIRRSLMAGLGVGIAGGFAAKLFADFEQGLAGVEKTTGMAGRELKEFGAGIKALARDSAFGTDALLEIAQAAGQLGVQGRDNLLAYTEAVAMLGTASDLHGAEAAMVLARLSTITGLAHSQVENLASVFVALGNSYAVTEAQLADSAIGIAAATSSYGVSADRVLAIAAAVEQVGQGGQKAGTAVGKVFIAMNKAVKEGGDKLDAFARIMQLSTDEVIALFEKDSAAAFAAFTKGLSRAGGEMDNWLNSIGLMDDRTNRVIKGLASQGDLVERVMADAIAAFEKGDALRKEYETMMNTLLKQAEKFMGRVMLMALELGEKLAPAAKKAVDGLNELLSERNATRMVNLAIAVGRAVMAFAGLRIAIAAWRLVSIGAAFSYGALKLAVISTTATLGIAKAVVLSLRGGMIGLQMALAMTITKARVMKFAVLGLQGALMLLKATAFLAIGAILMFAPEVLKFLNKAWPQAISYVKDKLTIFGNRVEIMGHKVMQFFNASLGGLAELLDMAAQASNDLLGTSFKTDWSAGFDAAVAASQSAISSLEADNKKLESSAAAAADYIGDQFSTTFDDIKAKALSTWDGITGAMRGGAGIPDYGGDGKSGGGGGGDEGDGKGLAPAVDEKGRQIVIGGGSTGGPVSGRQDPRKFAAPYERKLAELRHQELEAQREHNAALALDDEMWAELKRQRAIHEDQLEQERLEYKLETERRLLEMHREGLDEQELAFYERRRELQAERDEIERMVDGAAKQAALDRNARFLEQLAAQEAAYRDAKIKADQAEVQQAIGTLIGKSETMAKIQSKWAKAQAIHTLLTKMPGLAAEGFGQAVAALPPPIGQIVGAASAAAVMAQQAIGLNKVKSTPPPGLMAGGLIPGTGLRDEHLYKMHAGELAVPKKDYGDVKRGVLAEAGIDGVSEGDEREQEPIELQFKGDAGQVIQLANARASALNY